MKTQPNAPTGNPSSTITGRLVAFITSVVFILTLQVSSADVLNKPSGEFRGMFKVTASTDPMFPIQANKEWFLDFGNGISQGKFSGSVAVSLRQNPNVKIRIMAWQYFPKKGNILIGNPYSEGSHKAVAMGDWQIRPTSEGFIFERANYQVVLRPADPRDY
jgi:hypothetical protein